jgi:DNA-directed RNA polymerase specialized sigma24 family protein
MSADDSVTQWIQQLKAGDRAGVQQLWERFFRRLIGLARKKLQGAPKRLADEEDVALSAFDSFCRGAEQGRFPQLQDRDNLWPLLVVITARKAHDLVQHQQRKKRGGGNVVGESGLAGPDGAAGGIQQLLGQEPTPEFAAEVAEECDRLLRLLDDEQMRAVAVWKMEGYTNEEIAARLDCVSRTVERKLRAIRSIWEHQGGRAAGE